MRWLRTVLEDSRENEKKVIILSHVPFNPNVAPPTTLCWNFDEVLLLLSEFKDTVKAVMSGHTHESNYKQDPSSKIHHFVFAAALESRPPTHTYAIIKLEECAIEVVGFGDERKGRYPI